MKSAACRARFFELLLHGLGLFLGSAFLQGLRSAFDDVLGFLQAQARHDLADGLDDGDLLSGVEASQNDVKLGLLLSGSSRSAGNASSGNRSGQAVAWLKQAGYSKVQNIGGIANLSVLTAGGHVLGFDCGPGNALMDHWCQRHTKQPFDRDGSWAASGQVLPGLLALFSEEPYLHRAPPKSTGRDLFHPEWLQERLAGFGSASPVDIQATLTEFTASACAASASSYKNNSASLAVCGGGAFNQYLMKRLQALLPSLRVQATDAFGLPALQVEGAAFAWLARQAMLGLPGNLPMATGAQGARVLGCIYPA